MNKRLIAFLSILSLFLSSPLIPVNAAAKAGAKCTKVGVKSVVNDKSYICTKSGKKLTWLESKNKQSSLAYQEDLKLIQLTQPILAMTTSLFIQPPLIQELLLNGKRWKANFQGKD